MNKVVLITGSSRGIGASIAEYFAKNNYNIIINYFTGPDSEAKNVYEKLTKDYKVDVLIIRADVSNEADVKKMVKQSMKKFSKIDVLVNNAGIAIDKEFKDRTLADFKKTFEVNLYGAFLVSKYVSKYMLNQK